MPAGHHGRSANAGQSTQPRAREGSAGDGRHGFQDQDRGGGAGGRNDQSGGASGSVGTPRRSATMATFSGTGRTPMTCELHFSRHADMSGHFDLVSQQGHSLPFSPLAAAAMPILAQSMAAPSSPPIMVISEAITAGTAAHACATGASDRERAISIASMGRRYDSLPGLLQR